MISWACYAWNFESSFVTNEKWNFTSSTINFHLRSKSIMIFKKLPEKNSFQEWMNSSSQKRTYFTQPDSDKNEKRKFLFRSKSTFKLKIWVPFSTLHDFRGTQPWSSLSCQRIIWVTFFFLEMEVNQRIAWKNFGN